MTTMPAVADEFENYCWDEAARRYVEHAPNVDQAFLPAWRETQGGERYAEGVRQAANDNVPVAAQPERKGDFMATFTASKFWPLDGRASEVDIHDIAHSLSMQCRYAGHCRRFYSVAEHSTHIYRWLVAGGYAPDVRLAGLLHDATEAYLVDVPRPLKRHLAGYKDAEATLWRVIAEAFELTGLEGDLPVAVHEADNRILADEIRQNMAPMDWHAKHDDPLGVTLEFWTPEQAELEFLRAFATVQRARQQMRRVGA